MGIKQRIAKAAGKAGDTVARLATLSPEQLENVDRQRERYLSEMPDPTDREAEELTKRLLAAMGVEIYNAYLPKIRELYIPVDHNVEYDGEFYTNYNIRYFNITKWVNDKKENNLEKLVNVYEVLSKENCNIALVFHRMRWKTDVYLAVVNNKNARSNNEVDNYKARLTEAIRGNFPGAEWKDENGKGIIPYLDMDTPYSVATASNIPTEKSEKFISQTIEKLLDGIVPDKYEKEYTLILLATPIVDVEERKLHLGELYSSLSPFASWQTNYTYNESDATGSGATMGVNIGVSAGIQNGRNTSVTETAGESDSTTDGVTENTSSTKTDTQSSTKGKTESKGTSTTETKSSNNSVGASVGTPQGTPISASVSASHSWGKSTAKTMTKNIAESFSETVGKSVSETTGKAVSKTLGKTISNTVGKTAGIAKSTSLGANLGASFARTSNVTATIGRNEGITQSFTNYNIKHALEMLEHQIKRYEQSTALGMWEFAAYVLSEDINVANNVAHTYVALTQGEESYMSQASINLWRGDRGEDSRDAREICSYLRRLRHPWFGLNPNIEEAHQYFYVYPSVITPTTALSGKELAYSLNFPQKSIAGLPVLECAEFGRNVVTYENNATEDIYLGNIFHMNHEEEIPVHLSKESLSSHVFITGSTGSGKSNTIYHLLDELREQDVHFLVVEPAKGEYKNVFGNEENLAVYGTNPKKTQLLRINPFSFSEDIHVLEHIDRLVEIFNVCWPMYAAMPAVLKDAIIRSYEDCGWDLMESMNEYGDGYYPSFKDVALNVKHIIDSSDYDTENKGAYKGSLLTRLQTLSNGLNRMIFNQNEIADADLFDKNVIIDISRVGSMETKSLIMGMLILKLQEYRMSNADEYNSALKHVTVLEEAHNLLKRTSTEQSSESANLLGKSVEMISNAIAEMRTYGEGFVIADQAPGLLDMSVIRNTNTKIIMRLPDQGDRELVGRAANLNDDQVIEIAKIPKGVCAVYQNEWVQPVLCKIPYFHHDSHPYQYHADKNASQLNTIMDKVKIVELLSKGCRLDRETILKEITPVLRELQTEASVQITITKLLLDPPKEPRMTILASVMASLFPTVKKAVEKSHQENRDPSAWTNAAEEALTGDIPIWLDNQIRRDIIQGIMTYYFMNDRNDMKTLEAWQERGGLR